MGSLFNSQNATIQSNNLSAFPTSITLDSSAQTFTASVTIFPSTAVPTIKESISWAYATYTAGSLAITVDENNVKKPRFGTMSLTHPNDETKIVSISITQSPSTDEN